MEDLFDSVPTQNTQKPVIETVIAIFDFEAQNPGDLGFKNGHKIEVLSKEGQWWTGRLDGKEGSFPFNYVQSEESSKPDESGNGINNIIEHYLIIIFK